MLCSGGNIFRQIPPREDEEDNGALVPTFSRFAKGSKSVSAVILQKNRTTHKTCPCRAGSI